TISASGEIGRRARFRFWCPRTWGFKSPLAHHRLFSLLSLRRSLSTVPDSTGPLLPSADKELPVQDAHRRRRGPPRRRVRHHLPGTSPSTQRITASGRRTWRWRGSSELHNEAMHVGEGLFDRRLSDRAREVIRQGAEVALNAPDEWLDELYDATLLKTSLRAIAEDPLLAEAVRRINRANLLHWASANVADPGMPVPINLGAEQIGIVRDLVRRGM